MQMKIAERMKISNQYSLVDELKSYRNTFQDQILNALYEN